VNDSRSVDFVYINLSIARKGFFFHVALKVDTDSIYVQNIAMDEGELECLEGKRQLHGSGNDGDNR
jgi:hypothetical protein